MYLRISAASVDWVYMNRSGAVGRGLIYVLVALVSTACAGGQVSSTPVSARVTDTAAAQAVTGATPPLHAEVAAALYGSGCELSGAVYGLGGRDLHPSDIRAVFAGATPSHIGLRGDPCRV